jgi:hypothetical protein
MIPEILGDSRLESKRLACVVMIRSRGTIMTTIKAHLSGSELEARYVGEKAHACLMMRAPCTL